MTSSIIYHPNFDIDCRECGRLPTVIVVGHICPDTELCGVHFFSDRSMLDYDLWNNQSEGTE